MRDTAESPFDEGFFMYSEELDLCRRVQEAGWRVVYAPAALVIHHEGKSSEQVAPQRLVALEAGPQRDEGLQGMGTTSTCLAVNSTERATEAAGKPA